MQDYAEQRVALRPMLVRMARQRLRNDAWVEDAVSETLVAALHSLPDDYRVPTVLRDIYGLPYQEIADLTARPLGTVKVMVHRGRASLRLRLCAEREA